MILCAVYTQLGTLSCTYVKQKVFIFVFAIVAVVEACVTLKYENFFQEHAVRARGKLRNSIVYIFGCWYGINKKTTFHPAHSLYFEFEETFCILIATFYMACTAHSVDDGNGGGDNGDDE